MLLYWPKLLYPFYNLQLFFPFSSFFFLSIGWYCGAGVFGLIGCIHALSALHCRPFLIIIIIIFIHKNDKITRTVPLLKLNSTLLSVIFFFFYNRGGGGCWVFRGVLWEGGEVFL